MKDKITEIFKGLVPTESLDKIANHFEEIADIPIKQLGVDSLAIMELVLRIEETMDISIDYETFSIEQVASPRRILNMMCCEKNNLT